MRIHSGSCSVCTHAVGNTGGPSVGCRRKGAEIFGGEQGRLGKMTRVLSLVPPWVRPLVAALLPHGSHEYPGVVPVPRQEQAASMDLRRHLLMNYKV